MHCIRILQNMERKANVPHKTGGGGGGGGDGGGGR